MALYFRLLAASIRVRLQYKWDFLFSTILYGLLMGVDFLTVAAILLKYRAISGWTMYEIALLSGIVSSSFGLFRTFAAELEGFEKYLVTGEFDQILIRPWPTLASLLARSFDLGRVGALFQGLLVLTIGVRGVLAQGAPPFLAVYVYLLPLCGAAVFAAIAMAVAAAGFWITRIEELQNFARAAPMTAANYPAEIYPRWLRWVLTGLLPVLTMGYIPVQYALGKGGTAFSLVVPFLAAVLSFVIGLRLWHWGERHYQSTGS